MNFSILLVADGSAVLEQAFIIHVEFRICHLIYTHLLLVDFDIGDATLLKRALFYI